MRPGELIAQKYRVLRRLGEGAMGSVWAAENLLTQRRFAIKLIRRSPFMANELGERMLREARACGRLRHKNVVEVYDVGETLERDPFLVMELLEGETLEQLMASRGRLTAIQVAAIGCEVASALAAAHDAGIIHRDLKPANIFLHEDPDRGRVVKVLDFGVSKLVSERGETTTTTGIAVGSPAYMSPEQATARGGTDHRSDLWSLGVVLFEAASGKQAFAGETAFAVVANILHGPLPDLARAAPELDPRFCAIISRCLRREVAERPASARQLAAELEELLPRSAATVLRDLEDEPTLSNDGGRGALASGDPVSAPPRHAPGDLGPRPMSWPRWLPVLAGAAALLALVAVALVAVRLGERHAPVPPSIEKLATASEVAHAPEAADRAPEPQPAQHTELADEPVPPRVVKPSRSRSVKPRAARRPLASCPDDKLIFAPDGKKRCALPGRSVD